MENVVNRIILVIAGLALSWCAVWGAGGINRWATAHDGSAAGDGTILLLVILAVVAVIVGAAVFVVFIDELMEDKRVDTVDAVSAIGLGAICFSFVFGAIVSPVGSDAGIGVWITPWDFLLVLGAIPMVFAVKEIVVDIFIFTPD